MGDAVMAAADGTTATASALASGRLADVLGALTGESRGAWLAILESACTRSTTRPGPAGVSVRTVVTGAEDPQLCTWTMPWLTIPEARHPDGGVTAAHLVTPAEALEILATRAVWPWDAGADDAPRFWCAACEGSGRVEVWASPDGERESDFCGDCAVEDLGATGGWCATGHTDAPPSLPVLVSAASSPGLREAVTLARELAGDAGATAVLRVMGARELREHHERVDREGIAGVVLVFAREVVTDWGDARLRWPEQCPYAGVPRLGGFGTPGDDRHGVHRAWPALRALAATGAHLLDLAPERVTLGIEAVGST